MICSLPVAAGCGVVLVLDRVVGPQPIECSVVTGEAAHKLQILATVAGVHLAGGAVCVASYHSVDWGMLLACHDLLLARWACVFVQPISQYITDISICQ